MVDGLHDGFDGGKGIRCLAPKLPHAAKPSQAIPLCIRIFDMEMSHGGIQCPLGVIGTRGGHEHLGQRDIGGYLTLGAPKRRLEQPSGDLILSAAG
jgi:hypothetical protein